MRLQGRLDGGAQLIERDRLGKKIESAGLERCHRGLGIAVSGDDRDQRARQLLADEFHEFDAVAIGQAHVGQHQGERAVGEMGARFAHRAGGLDIETHLEHREFEQLAQIGFVIDDEYAGDAFALWNECGGIDGHETSASSVTPDSAPAAMRSVNAQP